MNVWTPFLVVVAIFGIGILIIESNHDAKMKEIEEENRRRKWLKDHR